MHRLMYPALLITVCTSQLLHFARKRLVLR